MEIGRKAVRREYRKLKASTAPMEACTATVDASTTCRTLPPPFYAICFRGSLHLHLKQDTNNQLVESKWNVDAFIGVLFVVLR